LLVVLSNLFANLTHFLLDNS